MKGRDCRSLYLVEDIKAGEVKTEKNTRYIRPGFWMHSKYYRGDFTETAAIDLEKRDSLKKNFLNR